MKKITLLLLILSFSINTNVKSANPDLRAPYAILMDYDSGQVLYEKNADTAVPPSSMSKLLTIYKIFSLIKNNKYSLDSEFKVGEEAWKKAKAMNANSGSTMFLEYGETVRLEDLIRGIIVNSGNDATIVVAENISGSEDDFVKELNALSKELGLTNTNIENASGWYDKKHLMSTRDLAILSRRIIKDFPEFYHYFGEKEFLYKKDLTGNKDNRNKLLWIMPSADGLKTGHTTKGGYGLSSSAKRGERRLISIVNGIKGANPSYARFTDSKALLEWGFKEFSNFMYYNKGDKVLDVPVWFGAKNTVAVGVNEKILITSRNKNNMDIEFRATFETPIPAPIETGTKVGTLTLYINGAKFNSYDLVTLEDVKKCNFVIRIFKNLKQILLRIVG